MSTVEVAPPPDYVAATFEHGLTAAFDFASVGYAGASHGCVNIRDYAKLAKLFKRVHVGDKVVVYRSWP